METLWKKLADNFSGPAANAKEVKSYGKGERPLKIPEGYDFSTRNVDWNQYKEDYILRTDAVWEKSKLKDYFYSLFKTMMYDPKTNEYKVNDLRIVPLPTTTADHLEDVKVFKGWSEVDGCIWQFKQGPKIVSPSTFSHYCAEKEGDSWYLCYIGF